MVSTDGEHGQLSLNGVDHVGHRTGDVLESADEDLVYHHTETEQLTQSV